MQTLMVYSESGGATKTTTAVSLAMTAALSGRKVLLIDLDPRAASTKWFDVEPKEKWQHVGAILADEEPTGWAEELAVPSGWDDNLRVVPSSRGVSNREAEQADHAELRLRMALEGVDADLVVIDCPNRQGGPLIQNALNVSDTVVYAATPTRDGVDGVYGARESVKKFTDSRRLIGAPANLAEAGVIIGGVPSTIMTRIQVAMIDELRDTGLLLTPLVPHRTVVQETRSNGEWYGNYGKGQPVAEAYRELSEGILK